MLVSSLTFAQRRGQTIKWFSLGAKGTIGNSFFLNMDVLNDKNIEPDYFSIAYSYGGRFTFTYGDYVGFGVELLSSAMNQDYAIADGVVSYEKNINLKTTDITPFFRYTGDKGGYFEIGPRFSTVKSVSETNSQDLNFKNTDNLIEYYGPKFTSAMIGTGLSVVTTERIVVNLGVRASYSFSDLNPDKTYYVADDYVYRPSYDFTATTNPISIQFVAEIDYSFAFWGNASCGRGRLMFFQ